MVLDLCSNLHFCKNLGLGKRGDICFPLKTPSSYEAHFECHDIQMLGKSPIKWRQRPGMTTAVDWGVKHQFKQTFFCCCLE